MSRPASSRSSAVPFVRVNGKIRAREVRVIGPDGHQLGIMALHEAINLARSQGLDLVEIAPNAAPPVCRVIDYGKFRYEQAKKEKESRKHQHANRVKEVQISPSIDPHDYGVKLGHAAEFLCDDMKVKVNMRFRGRELVHRELGEQLLARFLQELSAYGHADAAPRFVGRALNVMLLPLPRAKRAKSPKLAEASRKESEDAEPAREGPPRQPAPLQAGGRPPQPSPAPSQTASFANNPFAGLDL